MKLRSIPMAWAVFPVWGVLVVVGFIWLGHYEFEPARAATPPEVWPQESLVQPARDHPTLLMFAHPRCPCTRSSVQELARLAARSEGRARLVVLFYQPQGAVPEWSQTDLWRSAAAIPRITVLADEGGVEAKRFHSETSGQILLYAATGQLLFTGGITGSRGHEGDNAGRSTLMQILNESEAAMAGTPVYGCSLTGPDPACKSKTPTALP